MTTAARSLTPAYVLPGVPSGDNPCADAINAIWPAATRAQALTISHLEDGTGDPTRQHLNRNGSVDRGCFQVNSVHRVDGALMLQAAPNVEYALSLFHAQGWRPWTTCKKAGLC